MRGLLGSLSAFAVVIFLANVSSGASDCGKKLLNGDQQSSRSLHVLANFDENMSIQDQVFTLLHRALDQAGCTNTQIEIKSWSCQRIIPNKDYTNVCYLSTDLGYFFIMKDYVDSANVVFNRWD